MLCCGLGLIESFNKGLGVSFSESSERELDLDFIFRVISWMMSVWVGIESFSTITD